MSALKVDVGPGCWVCYAERDSAWIVLLAGGDKSTQRQDIELAIELARDRRDLQEHSDATFYLVIEAIVLSPIGASIGSHSHGHV